MLDLFLFKICMKSYNLVVISQFYSIGASSGIGRATAIHFASLGSRLALCGRNESALQVKCLSVISVTKYCASYYDVRLL